MPDNWRYWRVYVTADNGASFIEITEIEFLLDSVDKTGSGEAHVYYSNASDSITGTGAGDFDAAPLFDNSTLTWWSTNGGSYPQVCMYDFIGRQTVNGASLRITATATRGPKNFLIQCSNDDSLTDWVTAYTATNVSWTASEKKTFSFDSPTYRSGARSWAIIQR